MNFCQLKSHQIFIALALPATIIVLIPFGEMNYLRVFLTVFISGVILTWVYQVGRKSYSLIKGYSSLSIKMFKINFWYSVLFSLFIGLVMILRLQPKLLDGLLFYLVVPMQLYYVYSFIYLFYFVSKAIKSMDLGRVPVFSEYLPEIIQMWFFPIGIWWLQPKINRIVKSTP